MSWTDEKVQKLKELWKKGHTASQIAEMLGDTTRNAVIGKAHRLNLEARAPSKSSHTSGTSSGQNKIQRRPSQQPLTRKQKFQSILLDKNFEPENPKSLEELSEDTCKWPIGHPNEESFISAVENQKKIFHIANYTFYMHFNPKVKKRMFWIRMMKYQNLLRKKLSLQVNNILTI